MPLSETIRRCRGWLLPPADLTDLIRLVQRSRRELGAEPPDEYMSFLRQANGTFANGLMIYPSDDVIADSVALPGMVDINVNRRRWRQGLEEIVVLGEFDDDYLGFRPFDAGYWRIDRVSLDLCERFDSLDSLAMGILERV